MKLYKEILIESAEQAEALPVGTIARHAAGPGMDHAHKVSAIGRDVWVAVGGNCTNVEMVGWSALVPIEAEEEHKGIPLFPRPADAPWPPRSTPNQDVDGRWYYIDEDGRSIGYLGDQPFHDLMVAWIDSLPRITRYTTPWEPQQ